MVDKILDNVKKLQKADVGDKRILEQIKRAAENNEVISNYERNYVAKLVEQHLKSLEPISELTLEPIQKQITTDKEKMSKVVKQTSTPTIVESKPRKNKNTTIMIGGGVAAVVIIIAVAIASSGVQDFGSSNVSPPAQSVSGLTIEIDQSSYSKGDIISISGQSKTSLGNTVALSIENTNGELIWSEDVKIKDNGEFSTLAIAGGPGWDKSGTFTLKAEHGSVENKISFSFKNS